MADRVNVEVTQQERDALLPSISTRIGWELPDDVDLDERNHRVARDVQMMLVCGAGPPWIIGGERGELERLLEALLPLEREALDAQRSPLPVDLNEGFHRQRADMLDQALDATSAAKRLLARVRRDQEP